MNFQIIQKKEIKSTIWDGGETFEYFIYPKESKYTERNFLFRISSATILKTPSNFTQFDNYNRFLVMLDNELKINRNGNDEQYAVHEIFEFPSSDSIISNSLGMDFNLMVSEKIKNPTIEINNHFNQINSSFCAVFALNDCQIQMNQENFTLQIHDLCLIENLDKEIFSIHSNQNLIVVQIDFD